MAWNPGGPVTGASVVVTGAGVGAGIIDFTAGEPGKGQHRMVAPPLQWPRTVCIPTQSRVVVSIHLPGLPVRSHVGPGGGVGGAGVGAGVGCTAVVVATKTVKCKTWPWEFEQQ